MRRAPLLALGAAVIALVANAAPAVAASVPSRLAAHVGASSVRGSTSVVVWDQQSREVLFSRSADRPVTPASTMKLLTSAAVLAHFGAEHRFETRLYTSGALDPADATRWVGHLYLVGGGDPSLSTAGFARDNFGAIRAGANIATLTATLRRLGVRTVTGNLYVVDDELDQVRYVREWNPSFRYEETGALGALTVNQAQLGRWIGGRSSRTPDVHAGAVLRGLFARDGVRIAGTVRPGSLPTYAAASATLQGPPLRVLLQQMNRQSDNFYAEVLLKDLGRAVYGPGHGTTAEGRRAGRAQLRALGVNVDALTWVDGSGLAYGNRVTARLLSHVLGLGAQAAWGDAWVTSFARSGVTGTIRTRMATWPYRDRVHAKTGTLRHVSALAGFSTRLGTSDRYGFVVITSNSSRAQVPYTAARRLQDRVAMTLVR